MTNDEPRELSRSLWRLAVVLVRVTGLRNVEIVNGLKFHSERPVMAKVNVTPDDNGISCVLTSDVRDRKGRLIEERPHVNGLIEVSDAAPAIDAAPPGEPPMGWFPHTYPDDGLL